MKIKTAMPTFLKFICSIFKTKKMSNQDYVWYAGYGSNLFKDRFHCYILGGTPPGADHSNQGCTNKTLPIQEEPHLVNHDLYFAKSSSKWQGGGMGFIRIESNPGTFAYCNMYLITKEQFCEVVQQENALTDHLSLDFDRIIKEGNYVFRNGSTYGNLLYVGNKNNHPIFTFTNEQNLIPARRPSEQYLKMITSGLLQTHNLNKESLVSYLINREGVKDSYSKEMLENIFDSASDSK